MAEKVRMHIVEDIALLSKNERGQEKRLKLIQWNGSPAKYDIRTWYDDGKCTRGITLTSDEIQSLAMALSERGFI